MRTFSRVTAGRHSSLWHFKRVALIFFLGSLIKAHIWYFHHAVSQVEHPKTGMVVDLEVDVQAISDQKKYQTDYEPDITGQAHRISVHLSTGVGARGIAMINTTGSVQLWGFANEESVRKVRHNTDMRLFFC
jgi:hypothetical protein